MRHTAFGLLVTALAFSIVTACSNDPTTARPVTSPDDVTDGGVAASDGSVGAHDGGLIGSDGTIDGSVAIVDCTVNGLKVPHGKSIRLYSTTTVSVEGACSGFSSLRECFNGALQGDAVYQHTSCAYASRAYDYALKYTDPTEPGVAWDYYWDGNNTPANIKSNNLRFDSMGDDDMHLTATQDTGFKVGAFGAYTVDRVSNPANGSRTGNIWTRDLSLSSAVGATVELGIRVHGNSNANAISLIYYDDGGGLGMHLSPSNINWGSGLTAGSGANNMSYDLTAGYNKIRIVRKAGTLTYDFYVNGAGPYSGAMDAAHAATWDDQYLSYPRIFIGDNYQSEFNAAYTLDYVKYRRGALAPGQSAALAQKSAPAVPTALDRVNDEYSFRGPYSLTTLVELMEYQKSVLIAKSIDPLSYGYFTGVTPGGWQEDAATGAMTVGNSTYFRVGKAFDDVGIPGLVNGRSFTIEAELKLLPNSDDEGLVLEYGDIKGSAVLVFNKNGVRVLSHNLDMDSKFSPVNLTDGFHKIRVVRKCDYAADPQCLFMYVYIDNNPSPALSDIKLYGNVYSYPALSFGDLNYPFVQPVPNALVKSVRWHGYASAPPTDNPDIR